LIFLSSQIIFCKRSTVSGAKKRALLNQGMNANFASDAKVSLALGFKNTRKEDSYLKSATP
jgi:hypothetical protein